MKKFFIIFCVLTYVLIGVIFINKLNFNVPASTEIQYAVVTNNNSPLFKTVSKNKDYSNIYFLLEESYYVQIISEEKEFYYVNYLDFKGYVLKDCVTLINETPKNPFLTGITLNLSTDAHLYSAPNDLENLKIEKLSKNTVLNYIGKIYANEIENYGGNLWYYVELNKNNTKICGYIYSTFTTNLTSITKNTEPYTELISKTNTNILYLNNTTQNTIILLISIPTIVIIFLFLKGFKRT